MCRRNSSPNFDIDGGEGDAEIFDCPRPLRRLLVPFRLRTQYSHRDDRFSF